MLNEKETNAILEKFFGECLRYWKMSGSDDREAFEYALDDVKRVKRDPYVPSGKLVNAAAKAQFVHYREMDLGRR